MACIFVDLDGTAFEWGTNTFLPGALEQLKQFYDAGNQIVFTTQREQWMNNVPSPLETQKAIWNHFPHCSILFGLSSPRIVINDHGAAAINHPANAQWNYDLVVMAD